MYTQFYWQIDLHNLFHFLKLRLDAHAQQEIRVYGEVLAKCAQAVAPLAFASFQNYVLRGAKLSGIEVDLLLDALDGNEKPALQKIRSKLQNI